MTVKDKALRHIECLERKIVQLESRAEGYLKLLKRSYDVNARLREVVANLRDQKPATLDLDITRDHVGRKNGVLCS